MMEYNIKVLVLSQEVLGNRMDYGGGRMVECVVLLGFKQFIDTIGAVPCMASNIALCPMVWLRL